MVIFNFNFILNFKLFINKIDLFPRSVALYYLRAKAHAQKKLVDILNDMLLLEAQDKKYLLNSITLVTDGRKY